MILALLLAASAEISPARGSARESTRAPLLEYRQVQVAMARIASEHKDLASVLPVGSLPSRGGRKLEALRLCAGARDPGRPAILLVADIDGPRVWTSGLALDHAQHLADGYGQDPRIRELLDSTTIYVIPRANPDAAEARFGKPLMEVEASGAGVDNDRDGRHGEDPPCDVDGDSQVTWMRVPDPEGEWTADPLEPRATIPADRKKGQKGLWKLVREGRDTDKDTKASEDAELDALVNRNFPQGWKEHAPESGLFATDEPEARDLCDFVLEHKDISLVLTYGALDDFAEKPKTVKDDAPNVKRLPPEGVPESDAALLEEIGRRYKKVAKAQGKSEGDDHGTFQAWCRYDRGLWCLNLSLWSIPLDSGEATKGDAKKEEGQGSQAKSAEDKSPEGKRPEGQKQEGQKSEGRGEDEKDKKEAEKPSDEAKRLRWVDAQGESARFVPWKKFRHPELGEVEIGGWAPFATIEPPEGERDALAAGELEFLSSLGGILPRVRFQSCTAQDLGGGAWEIEAVLVNEALLPLMSVAGKRSEAVRPVRVSIRVPEGAQLLAGNLQELVRDLPGSGGSKKLRWLVHGATPSALAVEADTDHAGTARAVPQVK